MVEKSRTENLNQFVPFATYYWGDKIKEGESEVTVYHGGG
jgi:hypothetical protein